MTEEKQSLPSKAQPKTTQQVKSMDTNSSSTKAGADKPTNAKLVTNKPSSVENKPLTSKLGAIALLFSLIAIGGTVGHYFWQQQQLNQQLNQQQQSNLQAQNILSDKILTKVNQTLSQQAKANQQKITNIVKIIQAKNQAQVEQLLATVNRLEQKQPSDWLIHEAEYLIRVAARTMWLERDTHAAIGLLSDANSRLQELNDPKYLPVRKVIFQDIESLKLMPTLATDDVVLALMALTQQVNSLPLAMVHIPQDNSAEQSLALSNDTADWQENLNKSWQNFKNTFFQIRYKKGSVEPLMSPQHQQHLKQNLALKIQLALWAATEQKQAIYLAVLNDIQQWLNDYFDMNDVVNQAFIQRINTLKEQQISFDYPSSLASLQALRTLLATSPIEKIKADKKEKPLANDLKKKAANKSVKTQENSAEAPIKAPANTPEKAPTKKTNQEDII